MALSRSQDNGSTGYNPVSFSLASVQASVVHLWLSTKLHNKTIYLLVYVDNIIITDSSTSLIQQLTSKLNSSFSLKQLGKLDYFLVKALPDNSANTYTFNLIK